MLKILLKKQLLEVNRSLFVNQKNGKARSKGSVVAYIALYVVLLVGVIGGMFGFFGSLMCEPLVDMGLGWLYFLLYAFIALLLGLFGSVFNTYGSLYAAKDNDLLLSLPIPLKTVIVSRLSTVYILGLAYSAVAFLPGIIVYLFYFKPTLELIVGQIAAVIVISIIVLILSTLLGLLVAKIATKIKNKTFISVVSCLAFIAIYYIFYFRAQDFVMNIVDQAGDLAATLQGSSQVIYHFGLMCTGDWASIGMFMAGCLVAMIVLIRIVSLNFMKLATTVASSKKVDTRLKTLKAKSVRKTIFAKEVGRFLASSQYILNCGLGIIFLPALGVLLLMEGNSLLEDFGFDFATYPGHITVILIGMLSMLCSMVDPAAPSVSLEGKTHWIAQSLPVNPWYFLREKMNLEWILTAIPMLVAQICILMAFKPDLTYTLILLVVPQIYVAFSAILDIALSVFNAKYNWSNEIYVIKQSMCVAIALFAGWIFAAAFIALYFLTEMEPVPYICIWVGVLVIAGFLIYRKVKIDGSRQYAISE